MNLQIVTTKNCKLRNDLGPEIMKDIFHFVQKPYNLNSVLWNRKHVFSFPKNIGKGKLAILAALNCVIKK